MPLRTHRRAFWWTLLAALVAAGLLSRATHTGYPLLDKYLGDALYAAMIYVLLRLTSRVTRVALWSAVILLAIECFQLTGVAARLSHSPHLPLRLLARAMGTHFSPLDLLAYAAGLAPFLIFDRVPRQR